MSHIDEVEKDFQSQGDDIKYSNLDLESHESRHETGDGIKVKAEKDRYRDQGGEAEGKWDKTVTDV